jgi:hypothetical protein
MGFEFIVVGYITIFIQHRRQYNITCIIRPSRHVSSTETNIVINTHVWKARNISTKHKHRESRNI